MTERQMVQFRREGDPIIPEPEEKEQSSASPAEGSEEEGEPSQEGENSGAQKVPFNQDPEVQGYIERQVEKKTASVEQKLREEFQGNTDAIRKEIGDQRQKNAEQTKIPKWFGGDQVQWDEYRSWMDTQLQEIEERAITKTFERAQAQTSEQQKAVDEATKYFQSELSAIEADKKLNPSGKKIDPNALLKTVIDNDLVDSKGRWNYRAGVQFLTSHARSAHAPAANRDNKNVAAATMDGAGGGKGGEPAPKSFKTREDFRKKRPW